MELSVLAYVGAAAIGAAVGMAEILSRYRDEPWAAIGSGPGLAYLLLNGFASVAALAFVDILDWDPFGGIDAADDAPQRQLLVVLAAGVGAMALFRSSLFRVRAGDQDIEVGPSTILLEVLRALDRSVDRKRAEARVAAVSRIMPRVDYDQVFESLPAVLLALMQNLSSEEQTELGSEIKALTESSISPRVKSLILGLYLLNLSGEDLLEAAVEAVRKDLEAAEDER